MRFYPTVRHEFYLYLLSYLCRFNFINETFEFLSRIHWTDLFGNRKKSSSQSIHRHKMKRRYRLRASYAHACTNWGDYCIWRVRKRQKTIYEKNLMIIFIYLKNIFFYLLFINIIILIKLKIFKKSLILNFKKMNLFRRYKFRNLLKIKLYSNLIYIIKKHYNNNDKT